MSAAADEEEVVEPFHAVVRAEIEHLIERMSEVESCAHEDVTFIAPILWGEDALSDDVLAEILHAGFRFDAGDDLVAVFLFVSFPVKAVAGIDGGNQDVEARLTGRCDVGVGDRRVADIDRHVIRDNFFALDVLDIVAVIVGKNDVMVRFLGVNFVQAEIEHESRARELLAFHLRFGFRVTIEQVRHRVGVIGIHDDVIAREDFAIFQFHAAALCAGELQFLDGGIEAQSAAIFLEKLGHAFRDFAQAALDVIDAVAVFDVGKNAEECGAAPGRHAEVLGLEREREFEAVIGEIIFQHIDDAFSGSDVGDRLHQGGAEESLEFVVRALEAGVNGSEFDSVIRHEAAISLTVTRESFFDVGFHEFAVAGGLHRELAPRELGHGVEQDQVHVILGLAAGFSENFIERELLVQKSRAGIEREVAHFQLGIASAHAILFFENGDIESSVSENHARRQTARTGANDNHFFLGHAVFGKFL